MTEWEELCGNLYRALQQRDGEQAPFGRMVIAEEMPPGTMMVVSSVDAAMVVNIGANDD